MPSEYRKTLRAAVEFPLLHPDRHRASGGWGTNIDIRGDRPEIFGTCPAAVAAKHRSAIDRRPEKNRRRRYLHRHRGWLEDEFGTTHSLRLQCSPLLVSQSELDWQLSPGSAYTCGGCAKDCQDCQSCRSCIRSPLPRRIHPKAEPLIQTRLCVRACGREERLAFSKMSTNVVRRSRFCCEISI